MKRMVKSQKYFLYLAITFLSVGCGNDLNRGRASEMISKNLPKPVIAAIAYGRFWVIPGEEDDKLFRILKAKGLITTAPSDNPYETSVFNISIGEKVRKHRIKDIMVDGRNYMVLSLGERKLKKITGIRKMPSNKEAEVDFTWEIDNISEIGNILKRSKAPTLIIGDNIYSDKDYYTGKAYFTLFDDGWRIMKIEIGNREDKQLRGWLGATMVEDSGLARQMTEETHQQAEKAAVPKPQAEPLPQPPAELKTATGSFSLDEEVPSPAPAQPTSTPPTPPAAPLPQAAWGGSWPWTSGRLIREDELRPLSLRDLELMRNEIYARHGWVFHRQDLRDHFGRQPWYRPMGDLSKWEQTNRRVQAELTAIEKKNIQTIVSREKALR